MKDHSMTVFQKPFKSVIPFLEKEFLVKFDDFLSLNKNGFYVPKPTHNKESTRFWLRFYTDSKGESFFVAGDFKTDKKIKKKIDFSLSNLSVKQSDPDPEQYVLKIKNFNKTAKKILKVKGRGAYLKDFSGLNTVYTRPEGTFTYVPFKSKEGFISALQVISPKGEKYFVKHSEISGSFHILKAPEKDNNLVYLVEGIRTGASILKCVPKGTGVIATGSLFNFKSVIEALKKEHTIVLCGEKSGWEEYENLRDFYHIYLVGAPEYDDMFDILKKTDEGFLKNVLLNYRSKNYTVLGLNLRNEVVLYLNSLGNINHYKKTQFEELYTDCLNINEAPVPKKARFFYFTIRDACRIRGMIREIECVYEGIRPYREGFIFYDLKNAYYILRKGGLKKLNHLDMASTGLNFIKTKEKNFENMEKLKPFSKDEIEKIWDTMKIWNFSEIDRKLLFGWIVQSNICGGLEYRTPIWITAIRSSGKSKFCERFLLKNFLFYEHKLGRTTTPKFIPRAFDGAAKPLYRDECEPTRSRTKRESFKEELEFLRGSVSQRFPERSMADRNERGTVTFKFCFSAVYTSIQLPDELGEADRDRFIFFTFKRKNHKYYEKRCREFERFMTFKNKYRFLKTCISKLYKIRTILDKVKEKDFALRDTSHKRDSILNLCACHNMLRPHDPLKLRDIQKVLREQKNMKFSNKRSLMLRNILILNIPRQLSSSGMESPSPIFEILGADLKGSTPDASLAKDLKELGISVEGEELFISLKSGLTFIYRLKKWYREEISLDDLKISLQNDGEFLKYRSKKSKENKGLYIVFKWDLIKEEFIYK